MTRSRSFRARLIRPTVQEIFCFGQYDQEDIMQESYTQSEGELLEGGVDSDLDLATIRKIASQAKRPTASRINQTDISRTNSARRPTGPPCRRLWLLAAQGICQLR